MGNKWKAIIYFKFSHCRPGATNKGQLCGHLLLFLLQLASWVILWWRPWEAGQGNFRGTESHPTSFGCPKNPRYLLNTAVPTQQVGQLVKSARSMGLKGTLSKTIRGRKRRGKEEILIKWLIRCVISNRARCQVPPEYTHHTGGQTDTRGQLKKHPNSVSKWGG